VVSIPAVVVLPAPLGPSRPKISPACTLRSSCRRRRSRCPGRPWSARRCARSTARRARREVVDEVYELFLDLDADEQQIDFPIVYCNAKAGVASLHYDPGIRSRSATSRRCWTCCSSASRRRLYDPEHPLQALVTNLDASPYVGRLAICRVRTAPSARASRSPGAAPTARSSARRWPSCTSPTRSTASTRRRPGRGDHRRGRDRRGDDRRDARRPGDPRPLPVITVDEPAMSITIGATPRRWRAKTATS
jgi:GTP-binding protein